MDEKVIQELREANNQLIYDNKQLNEDLKKLITYCALLEAINEMSINAVMNCKCDESLALMRDRLNQLNQKCLQIKSCINCKTFVNIESNELNTKCIINELKETYSKSRDNRRREVIKKKTNNEKKTKRKNKSNVVLRCDWTECGFETKSKKILRFHAMRHSGEKPFKCGECNAMFRDK